ncbi:Acid phosphatase/vanadium-dependent haloperoxidase-related protein [Prunus dulcis]|uniref:Acid phosphatase/vanadium-dependent haloperoxidase-related protein n=1 Tax=Prunus dulcis TaxID=3755 RepID=A0A4Y1RDC0_PRUDU|nr:Acid phosphatase/vanadium-dependent haloperoxidase-related protein [Prunus dulcis]
MTYKEKRWDSRRMLGSGGMPSSHSATVTALAVAIGFQEGTGGSAFAIAVVLACVVMYDATGVRLHAGRQAEACQVGVLATLLSILQCIWGLRNIPSCKTDTQLLPEPKVCELPPEHPVSSVRPLRDSLGHTPLQSESRALKVIASISTEDFSTIFPPSTVKRIDRKKSMAIRI